MDANLTKRIGFAAVAIPLALALIWLGGWPLALLVGVISLLGVQELYDLARAQGLEAFRATGMLLALALPLVIYAGMTDPDVATWLQRFWPLVVVVVMLLLFAQLLVGRSPDQKPLGAVAVTLFGVGYAAVLPSFLIGIRHPEFPTQSWGGAMLLIFPLVTTWICDTAAMFGGRAIGGPKLAPLISPGKTRAGGIAGVVGGGMVGVVFGLWAFPAVGIELAVVPATAMAILLTIVGQAGDLVESLFKREVGVKDSSNLIPGHGGILDRFDSLYVVLPTAALCYTLLGLT